MANDFVDVVRFVPVSGGTGDFVVSAAVQGYQDPATAGAVNASTYSYRAESSDLSQWEIGTGTWNSGTSTLVRTTVKASSTGSKVSFATPPQVAITLLSSDIKDASKFTTGIVPTARLGSGTAGAATALFGDSAWKKAMRSGVALSGVDLNTVVTDGFYLTDNTCTNRPVAAYLYLQVEVYDPSNWVTQRAVLLDQGVPYVYVRNMEGGVWQGWRRIAFESENTRVLLSTQTANNTAAKLIDATVFQSGFANYEIEWSNLIPATNSVNFLIQMIVSGSNQTTNYVSNYLAAGGVISGATAFTDRIPASSTSNSVLNTALNGGTSGFARVFNPRSTSVAKFVIGQFGHDAANASPQSVSASVSGRWNSATAVDGIGIYCSSGFIASGVMKIYGLR